MQSLLFILLYGTSYGLILVLLSVGLVITMGLMKIVNMAHCAFSAIGGYVAASLIANLGVSFPIAVVLSGLGVAVFSLAVERLIFAYLYTAPELDQVLITVGLNFLAIGGLTLLFGEDLYPLQLPAYLSGSIDLGFRQFEVYRAMVVVVCLLIVGVLWYVFDRTDIGLKLRAAVDNQSMAAVSGIDVRLMFAGTLAIGSGLAAIGGALGAHMLPLEPSYPFKYLILVLIVASLSGAGSMASVVGMGILIGVLDTAGALLFPQIGAFFIYILLVVFMIWPPKLLLGKLKLA